MRNNIKYYIFLFFLGSIGGWCGEFIFQITVNHVLMNPGTLSLMWCPIYGIAAVIISLIANKKDKLYKNILKITIVSIIDEYLSAFISEEFFNHQLWDYSTFFLNFQGRVCFSMTVIFVVIGLICVYFIMPRTEKIYTKYYKIINRLNYLLIVIFILNIIFDSIV